MQKWHLEGSFASCGTAIAQERVVMPEEEPLLGGRETALNQERILDHVNERLAASETLAGRTTQIEAFKRFLKIETERLRIRHRNQMGGVDIAEGRSYIVDLVICKVCQLAAS